MKILIHFCCDLLVAVSATFRVFFMKISNCCGIVVPWFLKEFVIGLHKMCCIGEKGPFSIRNRFYNYAAIDDKLISLFMRKPAFYICKTKECLCGDHVCAMLTPYLPDHLLPVAQLTPYLPVYLLSVYILTKKSACPSPIFCPTNPIPTSPSHICLPTNPTSTCPSPIC